MTREFLINQIREKKSYLCIGLDTDVQKIPAYLGSDADSVFEFNRQIIDATKDLCVAYKINTAFYEAMGSKGWEVMERTVEYIPSTHFRIADAKRGDIGNTSTQYAKAFFEEMNFDAITISPYMGEDSVKPFLEFNEKWAIILALTSNVSSGDFQQLQVCHDDENEKLYESVLKKSSEWGDENNLMYVAGATKPEEILNIRKILPNHFLLIPGVGAQGGDLAEVSRAAMNKDYGLLVNVSRGIIYAGDGEDFAERAASEALNYQQQMKALLES